MLTAEIIGNLGHDAGVKQLGGKDFVSFSVAHSGRKKNNDGTWSDTTTWVSVLWYGSGGNLLQYLTRGTQVFVRGDLSVSQYSSRDGSTKTDITIHAREVTLCGSRQQGEAQQQPSQPRESLVEYASKPRAQQSDLYDPAAHEDDLPF